MKPIIVCHRYLLQGKLGVDNLFSQLEACVENGFTFFETDIRRLPSGEFYISHDEQKIITEENDANRHLAFWKAKGLNVALNIKELGYDEALVRFLEKHDVIGQVFLFDFDIDFLGAAPQSYINNIHRLNPDLACAVRISDRNESIDRAMSVKNFKIIWLDEFDSLWVKAEDMERLKLAGKTVYCVAPDLHGFEHDKVVQRFKDFTQWKADGICTDYGLELREFLKNEA